MKDITINNALLALRKQMILGDDNGRDKVEALLKMRGVRLPRVFRPRAGDAMRRGHMAHIIREALSSRPMTRKELVAHIAAKRPDVPHERLYWRTASALNKLRVKGMVRREGRVWLAQ